MNANTKQPYFRGFKLEDILGNINWHKSASRNRSQVRNGDGYQDY